MKTEGRTGMMKLMVAFRNFANKSKNTHITRRDVLYFPKICYRTALTSCQDGIASVANVAPGLAILLPPKAEC
jgi:hypothetical protein